MGASGPGAHVSSVTTPHGSKPGASGMALVCRPTPIVRFMHTSETSSSNLCIAWHTARWGRYCFYPRERFTAERPNSIELFVYRRTIQLFFFYMRKAEMFCEARQRGFHPHAYMRGLISAIW